MVAGVCCGQTRVDTVAEEAFVVVVVFGDEVIALPLSTN